MRSLPLAFLVSGFLWYGIIVALDAAVEFWVVGPVQTELAVAP